MERGARRLAAVLVATAALAGLAACQRDDVTALSSDAMVGRNNGTPGSAKARAYIVERLTPNAAGAVGSGREDDSYLQAFPTGVNILAVVPGTDLADEYVMVGAHYDHLGSTCATADPRDKICNGATDNATGVAAVLNVADEVAKHPPRRSVLLALWDAEEDGMVGSKYFAAHPTVPLSSIKAYVNIDIQGANLLPSLRNDTFAVGAETGGPALQAMVTKAAQRSPLDVRILSSVFGNGYSDQSSFTPKRIPSIFLTDSAAGCYHTAQDDVSIVDWGKLERQRKMLGDLVGQLTAADVLPGFDSSAPLATFDDVRGFKRVVDRSAVDIAIHGPSEQVRVKDIRKRVNEVFAAGPSKFNGANRDKFLLAAYDSNQVLEDDPCHGGYVRRR